jgi:hypothetical protein
LQRLFALYYILPYRVTSRSSDYSSLYRFVYNLCLAVRQSILPGDHRASKHFPLPLSVFNIILASTPLSSPILARSFSNHAHFPYRTENGAADTLRCLVAASLSPHQFETLAPQIYDAAVKLTPAVDAVLAELLAPIRIFPAGIEEIFPVPAAASILFPSCRVYPGLIDSNGQVSEHAISILDTYLEQVACPNVEVASCSPQGDVQENALLNTSSSSERMQGIFQGNAIQTPSHQIKTKALPLEGQPPIAAATTASTAPTNEFSFASPSRAMKLSPGRWNIGSSGTRLVSTVASILEDDVEEEIEEEDLGKAARKRRKQERRGTSTYIKTPPATKTYRPVDFLLAVAADAEEELRKSTPSTSHSGGGGKSSD